MCEPHPMHILNALQDLFEYVLDVLHAKVIKIAFPRLNDLFQGLRALLEYHVLEFNVGPSGK
jgi:hypothetical protein